MKFLIQGPQEDPYDVEFRIHGLNMTTKRTCRAGENGRYCKHRFGILDGSRENVVGDNFNDIGRVQSWLPGTDVEEALVDLAKAEALAAAAKKDLVAVETKLARVMRN